MNECGRCGATEVRLYRPAGEFFHSASARCAPCARTERLGQEGSETETEIGWYVPLVLSDTREPWGYSTIPLARLDAWKRLPETP